MEAIKGEKTGARQLSSQLKVHASQTNTWKRQVQGAWRKRLSIAALDPSTKEIEAQEDRLSRQIGKLQVEVEWLRKNPKRWT